MSHKFRLLDNDYDLRPEGRGDRVTLAINGERCVIDHGSADSALQRFTVNGHDYHAIVVRNGDNIFIHLDGESWHVQAIDPIDAAGGGAASSDSIRAPMPGVIVTVSVAPGAAVHEGQTLMVIESMKLQTSIVADRGGVVAEVCFSEDQTFDKGAELLRFEPAEQA